jgi:thiol-disulfide isomerase/thioredoxin
MFDSNFDKDFSKEKKYLFDYDVSYDKQKEESIVDTTSPVEIKLSNTPSIFVKPDVFNCCVRYGNPDDSIWHVFVETSYHREGSFEVNSKKFKIALLGNVSSYFTLNQTTFYLAPYSKSFEKQTNNNQPYRLRQSIFVDNQEFSVDSINEFGDTAWILYRGYNEKPFGSREGLYALNIQTISLNNHLFNLNQLKGNYVLLDFWGTWCNPCIELIPRLKALNNKYKSKGLQLISIAYDNKDSYEKLMHMIKEKEMNWTNIYDNRDMDNNICRQYDVICYPTSILINPNGKIIFRSCGENDFAKLEKLIAETIK